MTGRQGGNNRPSEPERVALAIPGRTQHRHQQAAERENRHARRAGERRKKCAGEHGRDRHTAADVAKHCTEQVDQALGGAALGEQIAGEGE